MYMSLEKHFSRVLILILVTFIFDSRWFCNARSGERMDVIYLYRQSER